MPPQIPAVVLVHDATQDDIDNFVWACFPWFLELHEGVVKALEHDRGWALVADHRVSG